VTNNTFEKRFEPEQAECPKCRSPQTVYGALENSPRWCPQCNSVEEKLLLDILNCIEKELKGFKIREVIRKKLQNKGKKEQKCGNIPNFD
jgi:Zn finger protein HypA/HybF involved in hydrogenase expression